MWARDFLPESLGTAGRNAATRVGGRYLLEDSLGRGAMAEGFRAHHETLRGRVAVKIFHRTDSAPEEFQRQQVEVQILAGLAHRNIVTAFDAGSDRSDDVEVPRTYLVLELVDGCTLRSALADGPLGPALVRRLARQLTDALAYVHGQGIVHRDLKPAALLLAPCPDDVVQTVAKLTDFGVARVLDAPVTSFVVSGCSANYPSPEQACGGDATRTSDVYSRSLVSPVPPRRARPRRVPPVRVLSALPQLAPAPPAPAGTRLRRGTRPHPEHAGRHERRGSGLNRRPGAGRVGRSANSRPRGPATPSTFAPTKLGASITDNSDRRI